LRSSVLPEAFGVAEYASATLTCEFPSMAARYLTGFFAADVAGFALAFGIGFAAQTRLNASLNGIAGVSSLAGGFFMSVPITFPERVYLAQTELVMQPLYLAMGKAICTWSGIERGLADILRQLTELQHLPAHSLFYSTSSFDGKLRLVKAAVHASKAGGAQKKCLAKLFAISNDYSRTRNIVAHRVPVEILKDTLRFAALTEGVNHAPLPEQIAGAITAAQLDAAEKNFFRLSCLLRLAVQPEILAEPEQLFPKVLLLAQQLPSDPLASQPTQRQRGLERQRRAAAKAPVPKKSRREAP
jgi:hypothetical protein